jgi:hypothetical protein
MIQIVSQKYMAHDYVRYRPAVTEQYKISVHLQLIAAYNVLTAGRKPGSLQFVTQMFLRQISRSRSDKNYNTNGK